MFIFKDVEGMTKFNEKTSIIKSLSSCFDGKGNLEEITTIFEGKLQSIIKDCFPKIRIREKIKETKIGKKLKIKSEIKCFLATNKCKLAYEICKSKLINLEEEIAEDSAEKMLI